jgi:membrane protease YdiL (CAAX protease family)
MRQTSISFRIYGALILLLALLAGLNPFLPQGSVLPNMEGGQLPASKGTMALAGALSMLFVYGGLGYLGRRLSLRLGFADIWDRRVSHKKRFFIPALIGVGLGICFIGVDQLISTFSELGSLPHPPFPTSLVASVVAGIGEEIIFRLFFISFWVWLISQIILKRRKQNLVFWVFAVVSALVFAGAHLPSIMMLYGFSSIGDIPPLLVGEIILLNSLLSLPAAWHLRQNGLLAAIGIHFWTDIVWHVLWGLAG